MKITIVPVNNGYIVNKDGFQTSVFNTLEDVFSHLLLILEGRSNVFHDDQYGSVLISRVEPDYRPSYENEK